MAIKYGTPSGGKLYGTSSPDELYGGAGVDVIYGNPGNDVISGEAQNDGLYGQAGDDNISGGAGVDKLVGDAGKDTLSGDDGDDWLHGGKDNDVLIGGAGNDVLRGDAGNDTLDGSNGNNNIDGGAGNDTIIHTDTDLPQAPGGFSGPSEENPGTSVFSGGAGTDTLFLDVTGLFGPYDEHGVLEVTQERNGKGTIKYSTDPVESSTYAIGKFSGIETFTLSDDCNTLDFSSQSNVKVVGGSGKDWLEGSDGNQDFTGGGGADNYMFLWREGEDGGSDTIHGFNVAEGDKLMFNFESEGQEQDPDPITITSTESNGHTIYTGTEVSTGDIVLNIDVDAIGLPPPEYYLLG